MYVVYQCHDDFPYYLTKAYYNSCHASNTALRLYSYIYGYISTAEPDGAMPIIS